jgi:hypothetical protein
MGRVTMTNRYACPIGPCKWTWDAPDSELPDLYANPSALLAAHFANAEGVLRAHVETHSLLEWVQEVTSLQAELRREKRDAGIVAGALLRRLGGSAFVSDSEARDTSGALRRVPVANGFIVEVAP